MFSFSIWLYCTQAEVDPTSVAVAEEPSQAAQVRRYMPWNELVMVYIYLLIHEICPYFFLLFFPFYLSVSEGYGPVIHNLSPLSNARD